MTEQAATDSTRPEATHGPEAPEQVEAAPMVDDAQEPAQDVQEGEGDTFPRSYVEKLRKENATYGSAPNAPTSSPHSSTPLS